MDAKTIKRKVSKLTLKKESILKERQQEQKKGRKGLQKNQKTMNKMKIVTPYLSVIILNINGLNPPIKRS